MEENRHVSELLNIAKMTGRLDGDFLNRKSLLGFAVSVNEHAYDMSDPSVRDFFSGYLLSRGVTSPVDVARTIDAGRTNGMFVMLSEIENILDGVSLHVRDAGMIEALLRTDIDAVAGDVRLPFPVMEICVPKDIDVGLGHQATGMVLIDYKAVNYRRKYAGVMEFGPRPEGTVPAAFICLVRPRLLDGTLGESVLIKKFDETLDLDIGDVPPDLTEKDVAILDRHTKLAMALMLYLQSVEKDKALSPIPHAYWMGVGVPAAVTKRQKSRRHYAIIDVVAPRRPSSSDPQGGHHASPEVHWRKGHMRVLKDEKYRRNPNGTLKTIWIRPMKVGGMGDAAGERNVRPIEGLPRPSVV